MSERLRVDLRYVVPVPDGETQLPLEDAEVRQTDPVFILNPRFVRAFKLDHDAILNTAHGTEFVRKGDYVLRDLADERIHTSQSFIFESLWSPCGLSGGDEVTQFGASVHGHTRDFAGFMRKIAHASHGRDVLDFNVACDSDGTLIANLLFE